ncbi:MAG: hypothetical protein AB2556_18560, partial [Candidatus Thiodiazotropha sp.]
KKRTHDIDDIEIADGIHARAGRLALDARMTDERAARLLDSLPEGGFVLKLKFLREQQEGEWVVEDKFDPVRLGRRQGLAILEISRDTWPGVLTGIDGVFYQNAYPVIAVAYVRDPDLANLGPLSDGERNCEAKRVVEHFEGALRSQGLTPARRQKIEEWNERVHESGAAVNDVAELEKNHKKAYHPEGQCWGGHIQQRKVPAQWMENNRTHRPHRPRLAQRSPLPPVQGSPHL